MSRSTNPFFDAAVSLQKKWTEALFDLPKNGVDNGGLNLGGFAKMWTESIRSAVNQGLSLSDNAAQGVPDLLDNIKKTASGYEALLNLWIPKAPADDVHQDPTPEPSWPSANWMTSFMDTVLPKMPSPFTVPRPATPDIWQTATAQMTRNWAKFVSDLSQEAAERMSADREKEVSVQHFYESWLKAYETTAGRFLNVTAIGPARYDLEKISAGADTFIKYQTAAYDFFTQMLQTGLEALEEVASQANERFSGEITEDTLTEFFHLLMSIGEQKYHELFSSPLFCHSLETFLSRGLDFQKSVNDVTEIALRSTPIVTQSQADEIHSEVYALKKRIQELERLVGTMLDRA
ncbi:MAG: poly(R)-hydroxyalkanoic acid synthase subunit PhaE [Myxococcota bacterium]|nr:poly(R)-hydroxyalkanoic acid synthase subunit PhaE [Myxococcota bacterium]